MELMLLKVRKNFWGRGRGIDAVIIYNEEEEANDESSWKSVQSAVKTHFPNLTIVRFCPMKSFSER